MPLNILGNFGQSLTVPLMSEQAGISVRLSDGGYLSVSPGFGLVAGQAVGVAAGAANVNAVGASIAAAAGSSTSLSVVAATSGAAGATEAVGAAGGLAAVSGAGASVAASAGASAGAATTAAVGSSGAANEAAGTAAGVATGSAVGAPLAAGVGSVDGVATAEAVGAAQGGSPGTSAGVASVSGVGASTVARLGISDAVASVSGVGEAVSGSFDPASLFGSGEAGFFFDFTTADCYTDTSRTTGASIGNSVAGVTDLSGNGQHASMSTSGSRPAIQQTGGGLQHLVFDGVDDRLELTCDMTGVTSATIWAVISKDGDVDDGRVVGNDLNGGLFKLTAPNTAADLRYAIRARRTDNTFERTAFSASTYAAPDLAYLVGWAAGDSSTPSIVLRRNGAEVGSEPSSTILWSGLGSQAWRIGNQQFGNEDFQGKIFAIGLIGRILTSGELSDLEAWCATRGGI